MTASFIVGWEEWVALPELGLPAIRAKVDTGAKTSALSAFVVEPYGPIGKPRVRFGVRPIPARDDVEIFCTADVIDRREVTSSNGESELRYVIRTIADMGGRRWPIELTLANRESMSYRMLIGRQAILDDMFVDPSASFRQPKLSYRLYSDQSSLVREQDARRPLRIALVTRRPDNPSNRRLIAAVERRRHEVIVVDRARVSLFVATQDPGIYLDGRPLTGIDAVVVRANSAVNAFTVAAVRQLEIMGAHAINTADGLARLRDPLALRQTLARNGVLVPEAAVSHSDLASRRGEDAPVLADTMASIGLGDLLRFAVVGNRAVAAIEREAADALGEDKEWRRVTLTGAPYEAAQAAAVRAALALSLGLVSVDVAPSRIGPVVVGVTTNISIAQFERLTDVALSDAVVIQIERALGSVAGRRQSSG